MTNPEDGKIETGKRIGKSHMFPDKTMVKKKTWFPVQMFRTKALGILHCKLAVPGGEGRTEGHLAAPYQDASGATALAGQP